MSEDYTQFQAAADASAAWANPLSRKERAELARRLARACKRSYDARTEVPDVYADAPTVIARTLVSGEMSELHLDVTERAAVAAA